MATKKKAAKKRTKKAAKKATKKATKKAARRVNNLKFPCQVFTQGNTEIILFYGNAKDLNKLCQANQFNDESEDGYQRVVSPSRRKKIAQFLNEGNMIPMSILLSLTKAKVNSSKTEITIPETKESGWIIDGQHRLAGASDAKEDVILPVVAIIGLTQQEQVDLFVTINKEQKGVPTSLYYELLKKLPKKLDEKQIQADRAADLARALRTDEKSPYFNRIVTSTSPKPGQLSMTNFVRKLSPYMKRGSGRLNAFTDDQRVKIMNNLIVALKTVYPHEFKKESPIFFKTIGFGAVLNVLPDLLDTVLSDSGGGFRVPDIVSLFKKMPDLDPTSWHEIGTGTGAENQAADDIRSLLSELRDTNLVGDIKL